GLDSLTDDALAVAVVRAREFVPYEGLRQHSHERAIAGEIHGASVAQLSAPCGDVQSNEGLARSRHPGDERNGLGPALSCRLDDLFDPARRDAQVCRT